MLKYLTILIWKNHSYRNFYLVNRIANATIFVLI